VQNFNYDTKLKYNHIEQAVKNLLRPIWCSGLNTRLLRKSLRVRSPNSINLSICTYFRYTTKTNKNGLGFVESLFIDGHLYLVWMFSMSNMYLCTKKSI
jgi:hypothetical protein